MNNSPDPFEAPFGSIFSEKISLASYADGIYNYPGHATELKDFTVHPGSHGIHYSSNCFEGLKAHRQIDGSVAIFRLDDHVARMRQSLTSLQVEAPEAELLRSMILDTVVANTADVPNPPGSLYIRPAFFGTLANVGAAASPTTTGNLYVLNSPVGDYFKGGLRPLSLFVEQQHARTTSQFGMVKGGANYALALGPTLKAKAEHGVDQVLFADNNDVTETGAANFFLVDDSKLITRHLDESFLHGITRASVIQIATDLGYEIEERTITVEELQAWNGEAFLSGTAAVIAPVGSIIVGTEPHSFGDGQPGPNTSKLRESLTDIQVGKAEDTHNWLTNI